MLLMYSAQMVVGAFFEEKVKKLFDLVNSESEDLPDLVSMDGSFFVEVKASAYSSGGVINQKQLLRYDREIDIRRFYAFVYHSIARDMQKKYPSVGKLRKALDLRSLYLFPFSVVKAFFDKMPKRVTPKHDSFVQFCESRAARIFAGECWDYLGLDGKDYGVVVPHPDIHIMTRENHLEAEILSHLNPDFL